MIVIDADYIQITVASLGMIQLAGLLSDQERRWHMTYSAHGKAKGKST
jgi:hypothetical protein